MLKLMKGKYLINLTLLFLFSCSQHEKFPSPVTEKISSDYFEFTQPFEESINPLDSKFLINDTIAPELDTLLYFAKQYYEKTNNFNLSEFKNYWLVCRDEIERSGLNKKILEDWFEVTGLLFRLSAETKFVEEINRISTAILKQYDINTFERIKIITNII